MAILRRFRESRNANIGEDNDGEKTRSRADRQSWRTTYPLVVTWTQESGKGFNRGDLSPFVGTIAITLAARDADLSVESRSAEKPSERRPRLLSIHHLHLRRRLSFFISIVLLRRRNRFSPHGIPAFPASRILLPERDRTSRRPCCWTTSCIEEFVCPRRPIFRFRLPVHSIFPRIFEFSRGGRSTFSNILNMFRALMSTAIISNDSPIFL